MLAGAASFHPKFLSRAQLGLLVGLPPNGSTYSTYLSRLKRAGLFSEEDDKIFLTEAGLDVVGEIPEKKSFKEIRAIWMSRLLAGERKIMDELLTRHPEPAMKEELSNVTGINPVGSTMQTYLSRLRRVGLVVLEGGGYKASDDLFMNGT